MLNNKKYRPTKCGGIYGGKNQQQRNGGRKMKFYWFEFEDGYRCCVRSLSKQELRVEERKHGKLISKKEA